MPPKKPSRTAAAQDDSDQASPAEASPAEAPPGPIPGEPDDAAGGADDAATPDVGFQSFGLSAPVLRALEELGFEAPTPIQSATIRLLMDGRDVIAQAQTGTGKTAAYGIPMVERIVAGAAGAGATDASGRAAAGRRGAGRPVQSLVLAPTRELAIQVAEALHEIGKYTTVRVLPVYGGQPIERQLRGLREGVDVVVGTPGRILDHIRRGTLDLRSVRFAILDEADEMLDMGVLEDVESILAELPHPVSPTPDAEREALGETESDLPASDTPGGGEAGTQHSALSTQSCQLALFSATIPTPIAQLARRFLHDPERIAITPEQVTVPQIVQVAYEVSGREKLDALGRVLDVETPGSAIVFCATRRMVDEVADRLAVRGYRAAPLHGDMTQAERERVLKRFRDNQIEVLVATDVAARGLDITGVTHVVNFDIPWDPEAYVHRIGRTGRAGRAGDAITLVTPRDYRALRQIEQTLRVTITRKRLPSLADVATRRRDAAKAAVAGTIAAGDLDGYLAIAGELGDDYDPIEVAAAALRLWDQARVAGAGGEATTLVGALKAAEAEAESERARAEREAAARAERRAAREAAAEFGADGLAPETGMTRLFIAAGRTDGLRPQDLVGAIANESGLRGKSIGAIDIYDRFSFVEVPESHAQRVVDALSHTTIRGQRVAVRPATPDRAPRGERPPRRFPPGDRPERAERPPRWNRPERGERRAPDNRRDRPFRDRDDRSAGSSAPSPRPARPTRSVRVARRPTH